MFSKNKKVEDVQTEEKIPAIKVDCSGSIGFELSNKGDSEFELRVTYDFKMDSRDVGREYSVRGSFKKATYTNRITAYRYVEGIIDDIDVYEKERLLIRLKESLELAFLRKLDTEEIERINKKINDSKMKFEFTMEVRQDV